MSSGYSQGVVATIGSAAPVFSPRNCTLCNDPLTSARLTATRGLATKCVPCKEGSGDEPLFRRYDESTKDGVVETTFKNNIYAETAIERARFFVAPDAAFDIALGDDSTLRRERGAGIAAHPLRSVMTDFEDELIEKIDKFHKPVKGNNAASGDWWNDKKVVIKKGAAAA
jgi:hypothetical protein